MSNTGKLLNHTLREKNLFFCLDIANFITLSHSLVGTRWNRWNVTGSELVVVCIRMLLDEL